MEETGRGGSSESAADNVNEEKVEVTTSPSGREEKETKEIEEDEEEEDEEEKQEEEEEAGDSAVAAPSETSALLRDLNSKRSVHELVWKGDLQNLKELAEAFPSVIDAVDETEWGEDFRPIHYAAYRGRLDILQYLIDKGALLDVVTKCGCTPLFYASQQSHAPCVKALLDARVRMDLTSHEMKYLPVDVATDEEVLELFRTKLGSTCVPKTPSPPTIVSIGLDHIVVSWKPPPRDERASASVDRYDLRVLRLPASSSESSDASEPIILRDIHKNVMGMPRLRVKVTKLTRSGAPLYCQLRAHSVLASSTWSDLSPPVYLLQPPSKTPKNFRVAQDGIDRRSVRLEWESIISDVATASSSSSSSSTEILRFVVQKRVAEANDDEESKVEEVTPKFWEIASRIDGSKTMNVEIKRLWMDTIYEFRVAAENAAGIGPWSAPLRVKTKSLEAVKKMKRVGKALRAAKLMVAASAASKTKQKIQPLGEAMKTSTSSDRGTPPRNKKKGFRWSFSSSIHRRDAGDEDNEEDEPSDELVLDVLRAGDLDGDGFWSLDEFNKINEKMNSRSVTAEHFSFLCKQIGDDPSKGLSRKYLTVLHASHEKKFIQLFYDTARALGVYLNRDTTASAGTSSRPLRASSGVL